jgi:hypothetical protein
MDHFLARAFSRMLRSRVQQVQPLFEEAPAFPQIGRRLRFEDKLNLLREIFDTSHLQRHGHALPRSQSINGQRKLRRLPIHGRLLEEQRLPAVRRLHLPIRPFADDQIGIDWHRNPFQFARIIQGLYELPERTVSHCVHCIRLQRNSHEPDGKNRAPGPKKQIAFAPQLDRNQYVDP